MRHIKNTFFFLLIFISLQNNSYSRLYLPLDNIGEIIQSELDEAVHSINQTPDTDTKSGAWYLSIIRYRVRALIGVEIKWLLSARVEPEIEIYMNR